MDKLIEKIKSTNLFSEDEKEVILSVLDQMTDSQKDELEEAIDDYQESISALSNKYLSQMQSDLDKLAKSTDPEDLQALAKINSVFEKYK